MSTDTTVITDAQRLDFLEAWARRSLTGVSLDKVPSVNGEPGGFRFMRCGYVGCARSSLRAALDAEIKRDREAI